MADPVSVTEADVLQALSRVQFQEFGGDLVSRNLVRDVRICEGSIAFEVVLPPPAAGLKPEIEARFKAAVSRIPGVTLVNVRFASTGMAPPPATPAGGLPGVKHVIAVGSGKGGVGKSTVAVNLAVALAGTGLRVGLLDADVYGPSIPQMMGIQEAPETRDRKLVPLERYGVRLMSLGFLMSDAQTHVTWRGPMVASAVRQMLTDVDWGELDFLLVDLPPGTGDAQLTLAQTVPLTGVVVVMTSQDVAVNIASKAVGMFRTLHVPILGVVGNMDSFACPHCGVHTPIFTAGGSEAAAGRLGVPFLGSIPLDPTTVEHGDRGTPTVSAAPESPQAAAFRAAAERLQEQVRALAPGEEAPDPLGGLLNRFRRG